VIAAMKSSLAVFCMLSVSDAAFSAPVNGR
jgi:hypothetical protein